jgi:hypothetical protein
MGESPIERGFAHSPDLSSIPQVTDIGGTKGFGYEAKVVSKWK